MENFFESSLKVVSIAITGIIAPAGMAHAQNCSAAMTPGTLAYKVGPYTVLAYVPESALGKPAPLVLNLHPTGGTGIDTLNESKHVADENGFIMVAPTGVIGPIFEGWTWNVPGVPTFGEGTYPSDDARNDVEFLSDVIDGAMEQTCVDSDRIYAMGFSGGARMASQLACDLSDRIASVVAIGGIRFALATDAELGLPNSVECAPSRPVPMQALHGHWDPTNPWYTEALGDTPFVNPFADNATIVNKGPVQGTSWSYSGAEALERWVAHNRCDPEPQVSQISEGIERREYVNCESDAEVSLIFFQNMGHGVPGYNKPWAPKQSDSPIDGYTLSYELMADDDLQR